VFVNKNKLEATLEIVANFDVVPQGAEPEGEEVVEVHGVGGPFALLVAFLQGGDLRGDFGKVVELFGNRRGDRFILIDRERKNVVEDVGLGEAFVTGMSFAEAGVDEFAGVIAVENGEVGLVTEFPSVAAEDAVADGMESPAPKAGKLA